MSPLEAVAAKSARLQTLPLEAGAEQLEERGRTVMWIGALDPAPQLLGLIAVADPVKPTARAAVQRLREEGIETVLLTGDNERTAMAVAAQLGIERVRAGVMPAEKAAEVQRLQAAGKHVGMVGDGVNDAPALAAADIGIAMGTGTDVAMQTAGITLMRGDPRLIADAVAVSRATRDKIRQGLGLHRQRDRPAGGGPRISQSRDRRRRNGAVFRERRLECAPAAPLAPVGSIEFRNMSTRGGGFMTIGEAASRSGMPPKTIRFYEEIGLIGPAERLANPYRAYREKDVNTLRFIHRARSRGFPLKDIRALLSLYQDRRRASREVKRLAVNQVAQIDRKIAELTAIRDAIADLAKRCHGDERPECPILDQFAATTQ